MDKLVFTKDCSPKARLHIIALKERVERLERELAASQVSFTKACEDSGEKMVVIEKQQAELEKLREISTYADHLPSCHSLRADERTVVEGICNCGLSKAREALK